MKGGRAALVFEEHDLMVIAWAIDVCIGIDERVKRERGKEGILSEAGTMTPAALKGIKRIRNRVQVAIKRAKA